MVNGVMYIVAIFIKILMEMRDFSLVQITRFNKSAPASKMLRHTDGTNNSIQYDWKMMEFVRGIVVHGTTEKTDRPTVKIV